MRNKFKIGTRVIILLGFLFSITGLGIKPIQAATCTWEGTSGTDWFIADNWSGCLDSGGNPKHPGTDDDVIIPAGKSNYPVFTVYQGAVPVNTLVIEANAQIIVDEQTGITATQFTNYGTIKIEEVTGHYLRVISPFDNHGVVNFGSEAAFILYYSGTHTGSFSGRQLSFTEQGTHRTNEFQAGSSINVVTFFVDENHSIVVNGEISWEKMYIRTNSSVDLSSAQIINGGEVILQGGTIITDTILISSGETFSGEGTLQSDLTNAGTVSPGLSPGTITVDGDYTQESTGALSIELGGTTPDTEHDQMIVTGTAALDGTLDVSFINEFSPELGDSFTIMNYASHTGSFTSENLQELGPELAWELTYGDKALTLTVVETGGTIEGTINYTGSEVGEEVTIGLFTFPPSGPPADSLNVPYTDGTYPYTFSGLPDGSYTICAWMDLDNSGGEPDPNEPYTCYDDNSDGDPDSIVISGASTATNIDFDLIDPSLVQGAVTYTGSLSVTGPISVSAHTAVDVDPSASAEDIQSGETFSIFGLQPGSYYISAYLDADSSGGKPDEGEPFAWYDSDKDGEPDPVLVELGQTLTGKNIELTDPEVYFSSATYNVGEGDGTVTITAQLSQPIALPVTVNYQTTDGTATGSDYETASGILTFPALETNQTFDVTIIDDNLYEGDETFTVTLTNPSNATLGTPNSAFITITDDDPEPQEDFTIFLPLIVR